MPTLLSLNPNSPWEPRGLPPLYLLKGAGVGPGGYSRELARRGLENASSLTLCGEQRSYSTQPRPGAEALPRKPPNPGPPQGSVSLASPHGLPTSSQQASLRVFELVQSLLGHTTWLTKAMGNFQGGHCSLVSFLSPKWRQDTFPQNCPPPLAPPRQTEGETVTAWL